MNISGILAAIVVAIILLVAANGVLVTIARIGVSP